MDPNVAYGNIRAVLNDLIAGNRYEDEDAETILEVLIDVCQNFENLNQWLASGGFLPEAWEQAKPE